MKQKGVRVALAVLAKDNRHIDVLNCSVCEMSDGLLAISAIKCATMSRGDSCDRCALVGVQDCYNVLMEAIGRRLANAGNVDKYIKASMTGGCGCEYTKDR